MDCLACDYSNIKVAIVMYKKQILSYGIHAFLPWLGLSLAFFLWWSGIFLTNYWQPHPLVALFSPEQTLLALTQLCVSADIFPHLAVSLKRVMMSLSFALCLGVPLGLLIGISRRLERTTSALFQFVRMISPLSWMPLAVMLFGIGDAPIYFLLTMAAVWPIILNTAAGVHQIDPRWLTLMYSLNATRWETIRHIIIPAILSHILTGLRLAIGIIWIVLVPAEMLGVSSGLGYYILDTRDRLAYPELMALILLIGGLGYGLDSLVRAVHRRFAVG